MKCVDFIILWVDGNDPKWQEKKRKYYHNDSPDASVNRYRDWDNLKYWFRSVAKFAPFVRKIHFITDGQVPTWLNIENEHIHLVDHKDYIPNEFLPVFNSNAIEIGMHRIDGLSDKFVCFNDDFFLTSNINLDYYYKNSLPVDDAKILRPFKRNTPFTNYILNNCEIINKYFKKHIVVARNPKAWLHPLNFKMFLHLIYSFVVSIDEFSGFTTPHLSIPYLKKNFEDVWDREADNLKQTQSHRFRENSDFSHFLFRFWRLCEGEFYPRATKGKYFSITDENSAREAADAIRKQKYPEICINDCYEGDDFETIKNIINSAFEDLLPDKCEFEL